MTAQEALGVFNKENPRLQQRMDAMRQSYDALCSHKYCCDAAALSTSKAIDTAAKTISEAIAELQSLVTRRQVLADAAFRESLGLKPRE